MAMPYFFEPYSFNHHLWHGSFSQYYKHLEMNTFIHTFYILL